MRVQQELDETKIVLVCLSCAIEMLCEGIHG